jgi:hypothetical protein
MAHYCCSLDVFFYFIYAKMYGPVAKEEENAVLSVSKKRTSTGLAPKVKRNSKPFASSSSNMDAVLSKVAPSKTFKVATALRIGKTVSFVLVQFLVMLILKAIIFFKDGT